MYDRDKLIAVATDGAKKYKDISLEYLKRFAAIDCGSKNVEGNAKVVKIVEEMLRQIEGIDIKEYFFEGYGTNIVAKLTPENPDNWPENSCSCLYTAAICKAVRLGILEEGYLAYARKGFEGVINSLKRSGDDLLIGDVCVGTGVGDYTHYINRPTSVNDLHGVGAFLIMCAECARVF